MPKLYTKTGDTGMTSLYDGSRQSKTHSIFDLLGDMDELNSHIGMLFALSSEQKSDFPVHSTLRDIQYKITQINSVIATPNKSKKNLVHICDDDIALLESHIDLLQSISSPLTEFILPGVLQTDAQAHICRAVTRRVERKMCVTDVIVSGEVKIWINRLSDFFFALSRFLSGGNEIKMSDMKK